MDIKIGTVLVDNLATLWQQHNSNSTLKEPTMCTNPAMQMTPKLVHKHLFKRIKKFNQHGYKKWTNEELYRLIDLIWLQNKGYKYAAHMLGRSKSNCKQMMHRMRKAGVLERKEGCR